jgi:hypothetical protein
MARRYAPALTRQEFFAARPKGNYQNYLSFLQRKRPGWDISRPQAAQRVGPPKRGPLPSYESMLRGLSFETPAQLEARANRMAAQQSKASQQMIAQDYKLAQQEAMNRMRAFAAAGNAAASMNASLIGQVGGQYQAGADQLNAMAAGGASMMAGATAADVAAANNALGNVGAPALSIGGPVGAPGIAGDAQAGVESYRGGTLPAGAMQSAGGYAMAGQAGQISSQNLRATQEAQAAYMQAIGDANRARTAAVKELAMGRPSKAAEYLMQLQDSQRQQYALAMSMLEGRRGTTQEKFGRGVTRQEQQREKQKLKMAQEAQKAALKAAKQEARRQNTTINEARSIAVGHYVDALGRDIIDPKTNAVIPVKAAAAAKAAGQATPAELRESALYRAQQVVQNNTDNRGNVRISRERLRKILKSVFPTLKPSVLDGIINGLIPAGAAKTGGGFGGVK